MDGEVCRLRLWIGGFRSVVEAGSVSISREARDYSIGRYVGSVVNVVNVVSMVSW